MAYPEAIDKFVTKLNKADTVYIIQDEELVLENGVFEGELAHDNVKNESVMVFTGPNMSGERVKNYYLSIPSNAPWKRIIKVFSNAPKVYVTYETTGDQVEAEDINHLQNSIVNTQIEVERYKVANDEAVSNLDIRLSTVENSKAEKTYVDTELLKKADKDTTYTKEETDNRIQAIIGAAPEALDTLAEIAEALNNDPDFAATMTNQLAQKVDKVPGMGLSEENFTTAEKQKLAGIEPEANKYIHPATHPASMVVESTERRFVSDAEKEAWNDADSKKHTHSNKSILDTITQALVDAWNSAVNHISDAVKHITSAERTEWNAKETPAGAQNKADVAESNAKTYTDTHAGQKQTHGISDSYYIAKTSRSDQLPSWGDIQGKPSSYTPSAHKSTHASGGSDPISPADIGAANQIHTHNISDVTNLQTTLDGKINTSDVVTTATANKILKLDANAKLPASITGNADGNAATASKLQTARTISLTGDVTGSASFDGSANISISTTVADNSHNHSTASISDIKANAINQDANTITVSGFYHCNVNVPTIDGESDKAVVHNQYGGSSSWATQIAISWRNGRMWFRNKENGTWEAWQEIAKISDIPSSLPANGGNADTVDNKHVDDTKTDTTALWTAGKIIDYVGSAGYGDMMKSVYDTDNDGKVDSAETADSVPWTGVTGKPSTFPPSSHSHTISDVTSLQAALDGKMPIGPVTWNQLRGVV